MIGKIKRIKLIYWLWGIVAFLLILISYNSFLPESVKTQRYYRMKRTIRFFTPHTETIAKVENYECKKTIPNPKYPSFFLECAEEARKLYGYGVMEDKLNFVRDCEEKKLSETPNLPEKNITTTSSCQRNVEEKWFVFLEKKWKKIGD